MCCSAAAGRAAAVAAALSARAPHSPWRRCAVDSEWLPRKCVRDARATAAVVEDVGWAGGLVGWQMPRRCKLHGRRLPPWFSWAAWRVVLGAWWLPRLCGMHRRRCHGGRGGQLGGWPERVSAATAVQAARATAASGGFVGGWAGGGCRGGAGCTGAADTVVKMGCCAGGGCNWGKRPQVAPLVALLVGGSAQGGYRSGVGVAWRLSVVAGAVVAVEWTGKRVTASVVVKVGVCMGGGCCCGARGGG